MKEFNIFSTEFWEKEWDLLNRQHNAFFGYSSSKTWDTMAEKYGCNNKKRDEEIEKTIKILEGSGVILKNSKILDIGCGPGYFAKAFCSKEADNVVCLDISERMLERLQKETPSSIMKKIQILHADWKSFDIEKEGFVGSFDLVFANMTPAVVTPESLKKIMKASKKWCWFKGWAGVRKNYLLETVYKIIWNKEPKPFYGNFIYAWNIVYTMGYFPYTTFCSINWTERKSVEEWVNFYALFFQKPDCNEIIRKVLSEIAVDGYIENLISGHTGSMLWSVEK